jgi:hypothetical protein
MRRLIGLAVVIGLGVGFAASPASAAPTNKNSVEIIVTCDNGQQLTVHAVHKKNENADLVSAGPIVGGGSSTVASLTAFEPGTTNVIFTAETRYGGPVNAECAGTFNEGGQSFDFVVQVHLVGV